MTKRLFLSFAVLIILIFGNRAAFPWTEKTHENLSEYAAERSVLSRDKGDYLRNLGFDEGLIQAFKWGSENKEVTEWLANGANLEDKSSFGFPIWPGSTTRSFNHFHNPLKRSFEWDQAGLNDYWTGKSSLLWAQDGGYQQNFPEGDWSWLKTREYFYIALTGKDFTGAEIALTKDAREEYYARTFRGLVTRCILFRMPGNLTM